MKTSWIYGAASVVSAMLAVVPARAETTLVIGLAADPTGFDPEAVLNNTSGFVMATIYDSLTRYKPGTTEVAPGSPRNGRSRPTASPTPSICARA